MHYRTAVVQISPSPSHTHAQPYECVGNSIGYQLLLQSHSEVTSVLIDSLYPALKVSLLHSQ